MASTHQTGQNGVRSQGANEREVAAVRAEEDQERSGYRSGKKWQI